MAFRSWWKLFIIKPRHQSIFGVGGNWTSNLLYNYYRFYQLSQLEPTFINELDTFSLVENVIQQIYTSRYTSLKFGMHAIKMSYPYPSCLGHVSTFFTFYNFIVYPLLDA